MQSLELEFADGTYIFALPVPQLFELQRVRATPLLELYGRVLAGRAKFVDGEGIEHLLAMPHEGKAFAEDAYETIRLGLIGGGRGMVNGAEVEVGPIRARQLVETYCYPPVPFKAAWDVAAAILFALVEGYDEPDKKKEQAAGGAGAKKPSTKRKSSATAR